MLTSWQNLVGAAIGCLAGGPLTDYLIDALAKRRGGLFKPEYRLWLLIPPFLVGPVGLMLWGCGVGNNMPSMVPIAGTGITYAVLCAVPAVGVTYVVRCLRLPLSLVFWGLVWC
jgi:hypothetical protein